MGDNHPKKFRIGSVIGNAKYENFLVVLQNVTINTADGRGGESPCIGKGVFLAAGSHILGNTKIGDMASVSANMTLFNENIPSDSIVMLKDGAEKIIRPRKSTMCMAQNYFGVSIEEYINFRISASGI